MQYFYVYILECCDRSYYIGHTENIDKRMFEHKIGKYSGYTSSRRPVQLVFSQAFPSRIEALVAERKLKKWTHAKKKLLITGGWEALKNRETK